MGNKDIDDVRRVMDRNQANRVAKQNGGGGFFSALGCGVVALLALGLVSTGLAEIIQHII